VEHRKALPLSALDPQAEAAALLQRLAGRAPVETHISRVFVGAEEAWKLRRPIRLAFLDFTSLEARRLATWRDFTLNQPMAPEIYRGVLPITRGADGALRLGGDGPALDWVVHMARVPEADFLDVIAAQDKLCAPLLDRLADRVVAMHQRLPPVMIEHRSALSHVLEGNLLSAEQAGIAPAALAPLARLLRERLAALAAWLEQRAAGGFVRRAHGDLHLGNICLWRGEPVPFDALEFDEAMATIDIGYDLAFLLMDLLCRANRAAANRVFNRYLARSNDLGLLPGLGFFIAMRALVRAHVTARMGAEPSPYLECAHHALKPSPPLLLALGGLPGAGKSTLARRIAPVLGAGPGAVILRADEARKRHFGVTPETRLPPAAYAKPVSRLVIDGLFEAAGIVLAAGRSVILDTSFIDPADRLAAAGIAKLHAAWLDPPLSVLEARVAAREGDASDADLSILHAAAGNTAALNAPPHWPRLNSADPAAVERFVAGFTQRHDDVLIS
jgi:aminoglycoside phosphotransferase family enzyme/predicted kinase